MIIPGAAVRGYVQPVADTLTLRGIPTRLLPGPGQPGAPADLRLYGEQLGQDLLTATGVDLLVGLSVGTQAAAVAAAAAGASGASQLLLVAPTVDPAQRTVARFLARWAVAGRREDSALLPQQFPEWRAAGLRSLVAVVRSAVKVRLEDVLRAVPSRVTIVHAQDDAITGHSYAAGLATRFHGRLVVIPGAVHSWPYGHGSGFADLVQELLT